MSVTEDQILRAWFESGPDGYPGRFDQVAESVKDRNRPRARAILALFPRVRAQALRDAALAMDRQILGAPFSMASLGPWLRERADMEDDA